MEEYINTIIKQVEKTHASGTGDRYAGSLRVWARWCEETNIDPLAVTRLDIENYLRELYEEDGYAYSTIGVHLSSLKSFFDNAPTVAEANLAPHPANKSPATNWTNPAADISMPDIITDKADREYTKKDRALQEIGETKGISEEQAEKVIENAPSPTLRNQILLRLSYQAMLRRVEIGELKLGDISLEESSIRIRPEVSKNGKERYTYYQPSLNTALKSWLDVDRESYSDASDTDYVFTSTKGGRISPPRIGKIYQKAVDSAEIGQEVLYIDASGNEKYKHSFHDLRHAGATRRWKNGCDLRTLQKLLGHSDISTTETYLDVEDEEVGRKSRASW